MEMQKAVREDVGNRGRNRGAPCSPTRLPRLCQLRQRHTHGPTSPDGGPAVGACSRQGGRKERLQPWCPPRPAGPRPWRWRSALNRGRTPGVEGGDSGAAGSSTGRQAMGYRDGGPGWDVSRGRGVGMCDRPSDTRKTAPSGSSSSRAWRGGPGGRGRHHADPPAPGVPESVVTGLGKMVLESV